MTTKLMICRSCGRAWEIEETGEHEEWRVRSHPREVFISNSRKATTLENIIQFSVTGEMTIEYEPVEVNMDFVEAASSVFCPIPTCLGDLEDTFVWSVN